MVREEASQQGFDINNIEVREGEDYFYKPAHLIITNVINVEKKMRTFNSAWANQIYTEKNRSYAFFQKTVLHIRLLLCQLFILQDKTVHNLSSLCLCVARYYAGYPVLVLTSSFNKKDSSTTIFGLNFGKFLE